MNNFKLENVESIDTKEVLDRNFKGYHSCSANSEIYNATINNKEIEVTLISDMYDIDNLEEQAFIAFKRDKYLDFDLKSALHRYSEIIVETINDDELTEEEIEFVKKEFEDKLKEFNTLTTDLMFELVDYTVSNRMQQ